jgi:hypothetical protein
MCSVWSVKLFKRPPQPRFWVLVTWPESCLGGEYTTGKLAKKLNLCFCLCKLKDEICCFILIIIFFIHTDKDLRAIQKNTVFTPYYPTNNALVCNAQKGPSIPDTREHSVKVIFLLQTTMKHTYIITLPTTLNNTNQNAISGIIRYIRTISWLTQNFVLFLPYTEN